MSVWKNIKMIKIKFFKFVNIFDLDRKLSIFLSFKVFQPAYLSECWDHYSKTKSAELFTPYNQCSETSRLCVADSPIGVLKTFTGRNVVINSSRVVINNSWVVINNSAECYKQLANYVCQLCGVLAASNYLYLWQHAIKQTKLVEMKHHYINISR